MLPLASISPRIHRSCRLKCSAVASGEYRSKAPKDIRVLVVGPTGYIGKYVVKVGHGNSLSAPLGPLRAGHAGGSRVADPMLHTVQYR